MSAVSYALKQLRFTVPEPILKLAFNNKVRNWKSPPVALDELITTKLLRPRVFVDADLVGGETAVIPLAGVPWEQVDGQSILLTVPYNLTGGREIISVLDVSNMSLAAMTFGGNSFGPAVTSVNPSNNSLVSIAARIADSVGNMPIVCNTSVELVGPNMVLVRNAISASNLFTMKLVLANEKNLNNISPRSWISFAKLVELAVKSYIFNTLRIGIDQAFLEGGAELGYVREYVDGLADAEEMYQTHLREVWAPTAFCNDEMAYEKFIKVQISPNL